MTLPRIVFMAGAAVMAKSFVRLGRLMNLTSQER